MTYLKVSGKSQIKVIMCFFFQMPIKQESVSFPIRKRGRPAKVTKKGSTETSNTDDVIKVNTPSSPPNTAVDSPHDSDQRKTLRQRTPRVAVTAPVTRRSSRKKEYPVRFREASASPEGQQATTPNRRPRCPKKLTYDRESSPEPASPSRCPTPRKSTDTKVNKQVYTRCNESSASSQETDASPRKLAMKANGESDRDEKSRTLKEPPLKRESSPETSPSHKYPDASKRSVTPSRNSKNWEAEQEHKTPTKRKILSPGMKCIHSISFSGLVYVSQSMIVSLIQLLAH